MLSRSDTELAAGATITLVSVFLLSCILYIIIGYGIDRIILSSIQMASTMPSTQQRFDTIRVMLTVFQFEPVIMLLGVGINTWVSSTRSESGEVDLSSMLVGASEMIILTLVIIALAMYGGAAIESVINVMNHFVAIGTPDVGLFSAVIYNAGLFYGLCVLALMGVIIQYIILCVRVVDYGSSY
jgi:hypothetical protein